MTRTTNRALAAATELVLAPFSFLLYRTTRFVVQRIVHLRSRRHTAAAATWQTLDGPAVCKPFNMLALMTSAPRWNTHAIIALAGPLQVKHTLTIHTTTAAASAPSWTVVVHAEPSHRIVASTGALDTAGDGAWRSIDLPPGRYRLALRYYRWSEPVTLPTVEVDGSPAVDAVTIPADVNDFYQDLDHRGRLLYLSLHMYVCALLRHRRWFPRSFVAREYLPAGNPQTAFSYGFLSAGAVLDIELDDDLLRTHDVYFTAYDRASLPVMWYPITERRHRTPRSLSTGSYLIRIHARTPNRHDDASQAVRVRMLPAEPRTSGHRRETEQPAAPPRSAVSSAPRTSSR
jgi:hypothetical protein